MHQDSINDLLTVIIISYNSEETIRHCLSRLLDSPPCRVLIIDNASTDESARKLKQSYPEVSVLAQPVNLGYGRAANVGLMEVATPYALLLNPDIMATARDISELLSTAMASTRRAAIYGPSTQHNGATNKPLESVPWVSGCAMLFCMNKLREIGFFDDNIFLFFEETDLCERTLKAGHDIIRCNGVHFGHLVGKSSPPSAAIEHLKNWHYGWSRAYYHQKHGHTERKHSPQHMLFTYRRKACFALSRFKRAKYRSQSQGVKAFLEGESAFMADGTAREFHLPLV